jgi:cell division septation protein DedD
VEAWRERLDREGRLELAQLGTFFLDAERNLQFESDRHVNHLKDAFGLRPVTAVPVMRAMPVPEPVIRELEPATKREEAEERRSNVLWAAAAFTAVLFAAATWVLVERNAQGAQWSGLGWMGPEEPQHYVPRPAAVAPVEVLEDVPFQLPDPEKGVQSHPIDGPGSQQLIVDMGPLAVVPESTAVAVREETMHYHVIGGCFSVKENAEQYQEALRAKGFSPVLVDVKGGLYRVALGSYPQRTMALEALAAARRKEASDAWLLVK